MWKKRINRGGQKQQQCLLMSAKYTNFAIVGAGTLGSFIVQQLLRDKAAGIVKQVVVLTRQVQYQSN
jgi:hypothetical protein